MAIYRVVAIVGNSIKAVKLVESYGDYSPSRTSALKSGKIIPSRHKKYVQDINGATVATEMTPEEKDTVDNKVTTLKMGERIMILDNFTPTVLNN
jgi:ribosomal protein S16